MSTLIYTTATTPAYADMAARMRPLAIAAGCEWRVFTEQPMPGSISVTAREVSIRAANRRLKSTVIDRIGSSWDWIIFFEADVDACAGASEAIYRITESDCIQVQRGLDGFPWNGMVAVPRASFSFFAAWQTRFSRPWTYDQEVLRDALAGFRWQFTSECRFPNEGPASFIHRIGGKKSI